MASAESICHIITPVSNLGYGFDNIGVNNLLRQLAANRTPTAIVLNSHFDETGSAAGGSVGLPVGHRASCLRDVRRLLRCVGTHGVPLILNAVSTNAPQDHLDLVAEMVREAATQNSQSLKMVKVDSSEEQRSPSHGTVAQGTSSTGVQRSASPRTIGNIVQAFLEKAEARPDFEVLLSSSRCRLMPFMAFTSLCLKNTLDQIQAQAASMRGGVLHLAKILEEGGVSAIPRCAGAIGTLFSDGSFEVSPVGSRSQCSSISVASHILQPKSRLSVPEVGGALDLRQASYQTLENRTVRVRGTMLRRVSESERWFEAQARLQRPYRSVYLGRITDALLTTTIDTLLQRIKGYVQAQQPHFPADSWDLIFHVYGRGTPEIIVAGEITANSQDIARAMTEISRMATRLACGLQNRGAEFPDSTINVLSVAASE
ncbi:hypothetical protein PRZ48_003709 [Zasmidium cellare]|uniref:Homoserine kinase n=1 Tax=Zasmidium cellare TaxID=395010 RepID=A0ABR0EVT8_ZASCE|nr:hypothetical protein PRZ48_003709 [Zasmidium cellare]